jgi:DNA-binding Lrp family transcriptional regulator
MDDIDTKILEQLNENARKSYREIARKLDVSLTTVANRIKKMEGDHIIERYIPLINQEKVGYDLTAVINVKISHGKLLEIQQRISKDVHVSDVYDITGEWDSLIIAHFKDRRDLNSFIKGVLSIDNVEKTNTQIVLNIVKNEKRVMNYHSLTTRP